MATSPSCYPMGGSCDTSHSTTPTYWLSFSVWLNWRQLPPDDDADCNLPVLVGAKSDLYGRIPWECREFFHSSSEFADLGREIGNGLVAFQPQELLPGYPAHAF